MGPSREGSTVKQVMSARVCPGSFGRVTEQYHVDGYEQSLSYFTGRDARAVRMVVFDKARVFEKVPGTGDGIDVKQPQAQNAPGADHQPSGASGTSHRHSSGCDVELPYFGCSVAKP